MFAKICHIGAILGCSFHNAHHILWIDVTMQTKIRMVWLTDSPTQSPYHLVITIRLISSIYKGKNQ